MLLVSGGENGQAFLWDLTGAALTENYHKIYQIASDDVSHLIKSGTTNKDIRTHGWVSMTWSSDSYCLAGARENSEGIVTLTHVKKNTKACVDVNVLQNASDSGIQCLRYMDLLAPNASYKNSLVIGNENSITLYDVTKQKKLKTIYLAQYDTLQQNMLDVNSNIKPFCLKSLAVNRSSGGHVAVGGDAGNLRIINIVSEISGAPSINKGLAKINDLQFNVFKQSTLAGATESGTVVLWDANTVTKTNEFKEHRAPALAVNFSSINETVLLSASLDKRCLIYDIQSKKVATEIKNDEPLTCLDYNRNGLSVALGTTAGNIFIYDLRSIKSPLHNFEAHRGHAVKCIAFQPSGGEKIIRSRKSSSLGRETSLKNFMMKSMNDNPCSLSGGDAAIALAVSPPTAIWRKSNGVAMQDKSSNDNAGNTDEMFSPLRWRSSKSDMPDFNTPETHSKITNEPTLRQFDSDDSVFSPLKENDTDLSTIDALSIPVSSFPKISPCMRSPMLRYDTNCPSPLSIIQENSNDMYEFGEKRNITANEVSQISHDMPAYEHGCDKERVKNEHHNISPPARRSLEFEVTQNQTQTLLFDEDTNMKDVAVAEQDEVGTQRIYDDIYAMTAFPEAFCSLATATDDLKSLDIAISSNDPNLPNVELQKTDKKQEDFQREYLKSVVSECMDDFTSDVKKKLWDIHWDITDNFRLLEDKIEEIRDTVESVVIENQRLNIENQALKNTGHFFPG